MDKTITLQGREIPYSDTLQGTSTLEDEFDLPPVLPFADNTALIEATEALRIALRQRGTAEIVPYEKRRLELVASVPVTVLDIGWGAYLHVWQDGKGMLVEAYYPEGADKMQFVAPERRGLLYALCTSKPATDKQYRDTINKVTIYIQQRMQEL